MDDVDEDGYPIQRDDRVWYVDEWGYTNSYSPSEERARRNRGPWFTLVEIIPPGEESQAYKERHSTE